MLKPVVVCVAGLLALATGCSKASHGGTENTPNIGHIASLTSQFGPEFAVKTMAPAGIDPKLLSPAPLPPGITVDPPGCAKYSSGTAVPAGLKGNMAAVTATGAGNQFVAIALETSQDVPFDATVSGDCRTVSFRGNGVVGRTQVVDAPAIDGAHTLGTKRDVLSGTSGKAIGQEVLNYSAYLGRYMVVVTVSPVAAVNAPPTQPDAKRAADLLVKAVAAVRN